MQTELRMQPTQAGAYETGKRSQSSSLERRRMRASPRPHPVYGSAPGAETGPHPTPELMFGHDQFNSHPTAPGEIADQHTHIVAFNPERKRRSCGGTHRAGGPALDALRAGSASRCNVGRVVHPDSGLSCHNIHGISPYDTHHRPACPCGRVRVSLERVRPSVRVARRALSVFRC